MNKVTHIETVEDMLKRLQNETLVLSQLNDTLHKGIANKDQIIKKQNDHVWTISMVCILLLFSLTIACIGYSKSEARNRSYEFKYATYENTLSRAVIYTNNMVKRKLSLNISRGCTASEQMKRSNDMKLERRE